MMTTLPSEHLKELRRHGSDVFECDVFRAPVWASTPEGRPYRPRMIVLASRERGRVFTSDVVAEGAPVLPAALEAFRQAITNRELRYLPKRILARGTDLVAALRGALSGLEIEVEEAPVLESLDAYEAKVLQSIAGVGATSSYLDGEGVDLARLRGFADAAAAFCRAAPWEAISEYDLCEIVSPVPEPGLRFCRVGGEEGRRSVSFFDSLEHEALFAQTTDPAEALRDHAFWTISFRPITAVSFPDADLWLEHDLPLAADGFYPIVMRFERHQRFRRPNAAELGFMEGLLRALSATTDDELDGGEWRRKVATASGETTLELRLPAMLEPVRPPEERTPVTGYLLGPRAFELVMRDLIPALPEADRDDPDKVRAFANDRPRVVVPRRPATNDRERAEDLIEEALRFGNRRRVKLAREALRLDRDCVDASLLLVERVKDPEKRVAVLQEAVNGGARVLGEAFLEAHAGRLWKRLEARPYLRARMELARALARVDRAAGARAHWRELLRLDADDHLAARYDLIVSLLDNDLDEEAEQLEMPANHPSTTVMRYARALAGFRRKGDTDANVERLDQAVRRNPYVMKLLLGRRRVAPSHEIGNLEPGSEDEGIVCAAMLHGPWSRTPGALEWLEEFRRRRKKRDAGRGAAQKSGRKRR